MIDTIKVKQIARYMHAAELKPLLKTLAADRGIDLNDPEFRFTFWVENGNRLDYEDHAAHDHLTGYMLAKGALRDKSRLALLDAREDHLYLWGLEVG